jgi:RNA polymerase sigma-70 factor, ECF subfamily
MEFKELILRKDLLAYSFFLTKNRSDAEDLLHDTYIRVFSKGDSMDYIKNLKSYFLTIMHNLYIDKIRKQKYRDNQHLKNQPLETFNHAESNLLMRDILKIIDSIREDWREPFLMHYKGFNYNEMAQITGFNVETLRLRVFYARRDLIKKLKEAKIIL